MKIVIAPNAFKGSISAVEAAGAMGRGARRVFPNAEVREMPLADGGDGTMETLVTVTGGRIVRVPATDPLGRPVDSAIGVLGDGKTAVVEMAAASGLRLLRPEEYNPLETTTYGTGELIRAALDEGVQSILIGIGGSATTDGGTGMAVALGARFLDESGEPADGTGADLERIRRIDLDGLDPRLRDVEIACACDVDNPLTGEKGAAAVYSPQKGATPQMVERLDAGLARFAAVIRKDLGIDVENVPGAGAAGGLGAGILAFLGGKLTPGTELVIQACGLDRILEGTDLVLTGEGRVDRSTQFGKVPAGVAKEAGRRGIPVLCFGGSVGEDISELHDLGLGAIFSICPGPMSLETALENAAENLERTVAQILRAWKLAKAT
jgi:glycerate kinase